MEMLETEQHLGHCYSLDSLFWYELAVSCTIWYGKRQGYEERLDDLEEGR